MPKDDRFFTVVIAPSSTTSKVRRISIHHKLLWTAGAAALFLLALILYGTLRLASHEALNIRYLSVREENEGLKKENEAFQNSYSKLKGQISYIEDLSKELARQARMEPRLDVDQQVGIGGPETVSALDRAADQLERDIRQINDRLRADLVRLASIPTGLPLRGYLTDGFGLRRNPFGGEGRETHEGIDLAADFGTPVTATADGLVIFAASYSGYGNLVVVYHSNGITTRYGHLSRFTVEPGQRVRRGDQIGHVGSTGRSTGPHVHYEIRENDQPVDPLRYTSSHSQR